MMVINMWMLLRVAMLRCSKKTRELHPKNRSRRNKVLDARIAKYKARANNGGINGASASHTIHDELGATL